MLDTSERLSKCAEEIGYPVEQLLTPLTRFKAQEPKSRFCIDNGAFSRFESKRFLALLEREYDRRDLCRFVAVPDVVASARRTLETFDYWSDKRELCHWPLAFVCQDGQENLPIPFDRIEAIFIGGSTQWKESTAAAQCIKAAQILGKWVHVGRVNDPRRFERFEGLGVDSVDGSGIARFTWMRERIRDRDLHERASLFEEGEAVMM